MNEDGVCDRGVGLLKFVLMDVLEVEFEGELPFWNAYLVDERLLLPCSEEKTPLPCPYNGMFEPL